MIQRQVPVPDDLVRPAALAPSEALWLRKLVWRAFLLRVALALVLHFTGYSAWFAPDETTYQGRGRQLAAWWSDESLLAPTWGSTQAVGYFYLNGVSLYLTDSVVPLKIVNAFLGALACRLAYLLANALFGASIARRTALFAAFLPSLVLWSSLNIRDIWVILLILAISKTSVDLLSRYSHRALIQLLASVLLVTLFRQYLFYAVAIPPIVALVIGRRGRFVRGFLIALLVGAGTIAIVQHGGAREAERVMDLETLATLRQGMMYQAASAFGQDIDISTPTKALAFLPMGLAYFFFSPFPWQITTLMKASSVPEMLLFYWLTPSVLRGLRHIVRYKFRECFQVLLLAALLSVSYALGSGNVGTLYRHRAQVIVFLMFFASVGIEVKRGLVLPRGGAPPRPAPVRGT